MKMFAGVAVALLCAGGASPLSAQGNVPVIPARAFTYDTVPARVDSLLARVRRDSGVVVTRNGPAVLILTGPRRHLADSLPVWCRGGCVWEWDEIQSVPQEKTDGIPGTVWGVSAVGAPAAWQLGATGRGVTVTALDSGIDPTHPGYVVAGGYSPLGATWTDDIAPCNGHGTHTAGTMADRTGRGVAPDARVLGVKVFQLVNGQCLAYTSTEVAGINWAVAQRTAAINISISGTSSFAMIDAVSAARAAGILVCRANGNAGTNPPNGTDGEIQTASVNSSMTASGFSNYGPTTDLAAPGESVESTMPGGGYGVKSGTSMAAPHVCGAVALVKSVRPDLSADAIEALLKSTAQPLGAVPNDRTGYGLVRPDRAIAALALQGPSVAVAPPVYVTTTTECAAVNGSMPFTATTDATWLTVWTTPDRRVCWTADLNRAPAGVTTTAPIYLAALPGGAPPPPPPPPTTMTLGAEATLTSGGAVYYAMAADGATVHVVYSDVPQGTPVRYARSTDDGRTFSAPITLDGAGSVNLESPLAVDGAVVGVISVNPTQSFNDGYPRTGGEVLLRRSLDGGVTWGTARPITSGAKAFRVALDIAGPNWNATWMDYRNGRWDLYATRSTDSGVTWTAPTVLVSGAGLPGNPGGPARPVFARDGSHLYLTWMDPRDNRGPCVLGAGGGSIAYCTEVYVKHSADLGATWDADRRLTTTPAGSYAGRSSFAAQGGQVLVVYDYSVPGGPLQIASVRSTDYGVTWSAPTILSSVNAGEQTHAVVALAPSRAYVAWRATRNGSMQVWGRFSTDGGATWSAEQLWSATASSIPVVATNGTTVTLLYSAATYGPLYARRLVGP